MLEARTTAGNLPFPKTEPSKWPTSCTPLSAMRQSFSIFIILSGMLSLVGCENANSGSTKDNRSLVVFAAASLTDALTEIAQPFEEQSGIEVFFNFASSGALARQIIAAPRADLYLSANQKWMDEVANAELLVPQSRVTLLSNQLTVIANPTSTFEWVSAEDFATLPFRFLSIGDPASVPAGRYAKQWLQDLAIHPAGKSAWEALSGKISPATDVRAALFQVKSNREVTGIVYRTDAIAYPSAVKIIYSVPVKEGPDISYPAAILSTANNPEAAEKFMAFLHSPEATDTFESLGFITTTPPPAEP